MGQPRCQLKGQGLFPCSEGVSATCPDSVCLPGQQPRWRWWTLHNARFQLNNGFLKGWQQSVVMNMWKRNQPTDGLKDKRQGGVCLWCMILSKQWRHFPALQHIIYGRMYLWRPLLRLKRITQCDKDTLIITSQFWLTSLHLFPWAETEEVADVKR